LFSSLGQLPLLFWQAHWASKAVDATAHKPAI
jgi:hypothetical protein